MTTYDDLLKKKEGTSGATFDGLNTTGAGNSTYDRLKLGATSYDKIQTPQKSFGERISDIGSGIKNVASGFVNSGVGRFIGRIGGSPLKTVTDAKKAGNIAGKFAAKIDVAGATLFADTVDFSADFLSNVVQDQIRGRDYRVLDPLQVLGKEKRNQLADRWKSFYENNVGNQTEALKEVVGNLAKLPAIQPSEAWSKASTQEKFSPKYLPETILEIGPGVVASLGTFAVNPALGFTLATGSVANSINEIAKDAGVPEDKALSLSLGTGLLVGFLDKIVPEEILNQEEKQMFIGALAKRVALSGLKEAGTEATQEGAQLLVESTLRKDLKFDEVKTRVIMSAFGGFLGGAGMQSVVGFMNNIGSGDIADIKSEDIKRPEVLSEVDTKPVEEIGKPSNLEQEAKKYKTADEFVKAQEKAQEGFTFGDVNTPQANATQTFIEEAQKPEYQKIYDNGGNDTDVLKAIYEKSKSSEIKTEQPVEQKPIKTAQPELIAINEEKIKNVTDIKSAKNTLKSIQVELYQAVAEAEGKATVAQTQREGINTEDVAKLKRIYAKTKAFQEGGIETIRASKHSDLVNNVVQNIQEVNPDMSDTEALIYALNLPTKAQESTRTPQIKELEAKQKTLSKYIDLLKTKQSELGLKEDAALSKEWQRALDTQEQLQKLIQVPSSQLPVGEGKTKISKLAARVKGVIGEATQEQIDGLGLQTYNEMNNDAQIQKATDYAASNTQEALRVINGEIDPPKGILKNAIYIALTELGRTDTDLATQISTMSSTRFGQEIEILKKIAADNPVVKMQEIVQARIDSFERRTGQKATERIKSEVNKIRSEIKAPTQGDWNGFLESIKC